MDSVDNPIDRAVSCEMAPTSFKNQMDEKVAGSSTEVGASKKIA